MSEIRPFLVGGADCCPTLRSTTQEVDDFMRVFRHDRWERPEFIIIFRFVRGVPRPMNWYFAYRGMLTPLPLRDLPPWPFTRTGYPQCDWTEYEP